MKRYIIAFVVCFSCITLADVVPSGGGSPSPQNTSSVIVSTSFEYTPNESLGDTLAFAVRLQDSSGAVVRDLQSSQLTISVDEDKLRLAPNEITVVRGSVFDKEDSISVFLVNGSGSMRLLNSERVKRFFSEIGAGVNETSGLVLYGNAQNGIDADWVLTTAVGSKVATVLGQSVDGDVIPDPALAIQDVFRKLAEQPIKGVRSIFMLTDGSGFESRSPQSVANELKNVFGKQVAKSAIDFYLIDFSDRPELSEKLQSFSGEIKVLSGGMNIQFFQASNTSSLLDQIKKDRQVDYEVSVRSSQILPRDGFLHRIHIGFNMGTDELVISGDVGTEKDGISYRNFMLAGIWVGVFAIIALAVLMHFARKA